MNHIVSAQTTMTSKGQIVLAKEVRDRLGLKPGDKIMEVLDGRMLYIVPIPKDPVKALEGMFKSSKYSSQELEDWLDKMDGT